MVYTVGEMARLLDIPSSTLRYYDKEGLLPFVERSSGGIRMFTEKDYEWLKVICCMKKAGMALRDIRKYIELAIEGDDTIEQRLVLFRNQREVLMNQMAELQQTLDTLDYKCWYYETALKAGSVGAVQSLPECEIPEKFIAVRNNLKNISAPETDQELKCEAV